MKNSNVDGEKFPSTLWEQGSEDYIGYAW